MLKECGEWILLPGSGRCRCIPKGVFSQISLLCPSHYPQAEKNIAFFSYLSWFGHYICFSLHYSWPTISITIVLSFFSHPTDFFVDIFVFYILGLLWKITLISKAFQGSWLNTTLLELMSAFFQALCNQGWLLILDLISVYPYF